MNENDRRELDAAVTHAASVIAGASRVTLVCHVSPDGDALGSTLALHHVLRAAGVDSVASFPPPFVVAPHYRDLPGLELLTPPELVDDEPEVMVTFDCGALGRLGELETKAKAAGELIVVDHHASNERYGTINVIDPAAAASGVLVRRLVAALGLPLTRDAAICLYAALICDTGRFQYESTTCEVFGLARGAGPVRPAHCDALAHALRGAPVRVHPTRRRRVGARRARTREALRVDEGHAGGPHPARRLVRRGRRNDRPRAADARGRGRVRTEGSRRRRVARQPAVTGRGRRVPHRPGEGGGGHRFAAGFTSDDPAEEVVKRILAAL